MPVMPSYCLLVCMTITQTVICRRFNLAVRLMAFLAIDTAHSAFLRNFFVTVQALLFCRHSSHFSIYMACQTCKTLHSHSVYALVCMTCQAVLFIGREIMQLGCMTVIACYLFHKYMSRVPVGFPHGNSALLY